MSHRPASVWTQLPVRMPSKNFTRLYRSFSSASSASSRGCSIDEKLHITLPQSKVDSQGSDEPLFQECYLSSEEELSPVEDCGDSFSFIDSEISDDVARTVPSLPEMLADSCPGRESEVATVVAFASAGRAKIVSVQVPAALRRSITPSTSVAVDSRSSRPSLSRRCISSSAVPAESSRPSRCSSITSSTCYSNFSSTKPSSSSTMSMRSQQTPLSSVASTPSPSFLDFDPFANAVTCPPQPATPRGHSRLRSLSQTISRSVLNLELDQKQLEPKPTPSKKENRKSLQMAARGATERLPAIEIPPYPPPYPIVGYEGAHWPRKDESKLKKLRNRKSLFAYIRF